MFRVDPVEMKEFFLWQRNEDYLTWAEHHRKLYELVKTQVTTVRLLAKSGEGYEDANYQLATLREHMTAAFYICLFKIEEHKEKNKCADGTY